VNLNSWTPLPLLALLITLVSSNLFTTTPAHAQQPVALTDVCTEITRLVDASSFRVGVVLQDLGSGETCRLSANEQFRSASLYKLVVLAAAYQQVEDGDFAFDEGIFVEPRHAIDDPPELRIEDTIIRNAGEAVRLMIQASANADALALRDRLGVDEVDGFPPTIGMESTRLGTEYVTTADDIASYFQQLYAGELVSPEASNAMRDLLLGQALNDLIPGALPANTPIAHKTGLLSDHLHDAGIIYAPGGDYSLTILIQHDGSLEDATQLIHDITRLAHQPFAFAPVAEPIVSGALTEAETAPAVAPAVIAGIEAGRQSADAGNASNLGEDPATTAANPAQQPGVTLPLFGDLPVGTNTLSALALGILATLLGVFSYQTGLRTLRSWTYNRGAVNTRNGVGEGVATMRLGNRKEQIQDEVVVEEGAAIVPASSSMTEVGAPPVMPSPRLERLAQFFSAQQHLLESIRHEHEEEMHPLETLLQRQGQTQQQLLANLEARLRPLNEYADGEEANLDALEQRMSAQGPDFIQRSFSEYLEAQRLRIAETRDQIDEQRLPLLRYGDEQRDSVEIALARFDADVEALELNLAEQRKLLMRMVDGMRSDSFVAVKHFLEAREASIAELAAAGITDPGEIANSAQNLRDAVDAMASQSVHIQAVLEATDTSDEELMASAPAGPRALPALNSFDDALAELEAVEATAEEIA
jgi:beta-lactamase class A